MAKLHGSMAIAVALTTAVITLPATNAQAAPSTPSQRNERFASVTPAEPLLRSRSDAAQQAAQIPGAAALLLEALRWRGHTAKQIGVPSQLWCADFMNFVLKRVGGKGTGSRAARSFLKYGKLLDGPRVGAIAILYRGPNNGHVGVVRGTDGQGNPILVSGNHGPTVMQSVYPKERVLGYVMPPDYVLHEMAAAARKSASAE
ncbi:MAG: TIGR02594 family protein [Pseudolabrys sp.]